MRDANHEDIWVCVNVDHWGPAVPEGLEVCAYIRTSYSSLRVPRLRWCRSRHRDDAPDDLLCLYEESKCWADDWVVD